MKRRDRLLSPSIERTIIRFKTRTYPETPTMILDRLLKVRPTHYTRLQVVSVFFPGIVLLSEATYWAVPRRSRADLFTLLDFLSDRVAGMSAGVILYLIVLVAMLGYIFGFLVRYSLFGFFNAAFRLPRWDELARDLEKRYDHDEIQTVLRAHPALNRVVSSKGPAWGLLGYCKRWLNERRPSLSIDWIEVDINLLAGFTGPAILAPVIVSDMWFNGSAGGAWVGLLSGCLLGAVIITAVFRLKQKEYSEVMRNFLIAHWVLMRPSTDLILGDSSQSDFEG